MSIPHGSRLCTSKAAAHVFQRSQCRSAFKLGFDELLIAAMDQDIKMHKKGCC
jgi:hypothetical protein